MSASQLRMGIAEQIRASSCFLVIYRPDADDPTKPMSRVGMIRARISHESRSVPQSGTAPVGLSTNLGRFIIADHRADLAKGDRFSWCGRGWEIGDVDPIIGAGQVIGYQATLKESEDIPLYDGQTSEGNPWR